ncbi:hypothetical protein A2U01_0008631 [Trifolium medium]|uniref:Uncharacterized protein n=1 Tax=Trifolium medium TaxID=97028 RepID=A0A392MKP5_9FABA|nr:hypothetical protein [Trifolium medium]
MVPEEGSDRDGEMGVAGEREGEGEGSVLGWGEEAEDDERDEVTCHSDYFNMCPCLYGLLAGGVEDLGTGCGLGS